MSLSFRKLTTALISGTTPITENKKFVMRTMKRMHCLVFLQAWMFTIIFTQERDFPFHACLGTFRLNGHSRLTTSFLIPGVYLQAILIRQTKPWWSMSVRQMVASGKRLTCH